MTVALSGPALRAAAMPIPADPVAFDGLFGWHSPGVSRRGVVLCGTLGFEQLSAHRAWRELAQRLAAAGCPTLRFDYPGEGDSGDDGAGRVPAMVAAIGSAARFLREAAGAEEIVLVGLRFGATLAALAAEECGADRLVLLAPFATGRAYLREMALRSRTIDLLPDGTPFPQDSRTPIHAGFPVPPDFIADLRTLDLGKHAAHGAAPSRVLLFGPDPAGLAAGYAARGGAVATRAFPGLAQLVANALVAEVPEEAFSAVVAFAADGLEPYPTALRARTAPTLCLAALSVAEPASPAAQSALLPRPAPLLPTGPVAAIAGEAWSETPVAAEGDVGILCRPRVPAPGAAAVLFINSGLNVRSGYGRQTTALARALAGDGVLSLRMDLRGVGDSPDRTDGARPLYLPDAVEEVRAGVDLLARAGAERIAVVGTCSGAFLGFHAVCQDARIGAAILVNLYCFDWNLGKDVETVLRKPFRSPATYATLLRQGAAWRRLLRGEVRVAAILGRLARTAAERLRQGAGRLLGPVSAGPTVADRVAALRQRGAALVLVFSAGEPGLAEVRTHFGRSPSAVARRLGRLPVVLEGVDHNLSVPGAQDRLRAILGQVLADMSGRADPLTRRAA